MEAVHQEFIKPTEDYLRIMTASPAVAIADPARNARNILDCYERARQDQAELLVLPELCMTGYSTADLFFNRHVQEKTLEALDTLAEATTDGPAMIVGLPIDQQAILYNCAALLAEGKVQGIVPKSYVPNYGEFYEQRWFTEGDAVKNQVLQINGQSVPFGTDLLFELNGTTVGVEICEDLFAPIPPSSYLALAGAELIVNPSASNELIGKADYRRTLVSSTAARLICGYAYTSAGPTESTADTVFGGHQLMGEAGRLPAEVKPLTPGAQPLVYDFDRTYIEHDRNVNKTFAKAAAKQRSELPFRTIRVEAPRPTDNQLLRKVSAEAHLPAKETEMDQRAEAIFTIMATGIAQQIRPNQTKALVLGLSGGLDSTLALLSLDYACTQTGNTNQLIHTVTMPGMGSSNRTQNNAQKLADALGTTHATMPVDGLSYEALEQIGHDGTTEDIAYQNTQARMRTLLLMNYANLKQGMVIGTGDMSEIAQGWCTFNGDHMSMYNPNAGVPKTLVRTLVQWYADNRATKEVQEVLYDILDTPVSPELTGNGDLSQATEDLIGPYELLDFFNKEQRRYGSRPQKIGYLACLAFKDTYDEQTIAHWLQSYLGRFTASQWKRESMPNGPKIGTVSHSPRTDLRMAPNTSKDWYKT